MIGEQHGEEPEATFRRATREMKLKQQRNAARWGLGDHEHWHADLRLGHILFSRPGGELLMAPVQLIGSYDPTESRWRWGWDHPPAHAAVTRAAELVRRFGEVYGLAALTTREIQCTEDQAWRFTAMALHLSEAEGAYRGRAGETLSFMTFGAMTVGKANYGACTQAPQRDRDPRVTRTASTAARPSGPAIARSIGLPPSSSSWAFRNATASVLPNASRASLDTRPWRSASPGERRGGLSFLTKDRLTGRPPCDHSARPPAACVRPRCAKGDPP